MRLSPALRELKEQALPPADVTRERARAYMGTLDITQVQFAAQLGRSRTAIQSFFRGTYTEDIGSDVILRERIESYLERHPLGVGDQAVLGHLYETENVRQLRECFEYVQRPGSLMMVCYGPPGSQKTYVAKHLVAEFNRRVLSGDVADRAYLVRCSIRIRPRDLLAKICFALGVPAAETMQRCFASIRMAARGRRIVLVMDETQLADIDSLEALRELWDEDNIGILWLGSHRLNQLFIRRAAELEQFNRRVGDRVELGGVSEESARAIVMAELPELRPRLVESAIRMSFAQDAYSSTPGKTYCNVGRLFETIKSFREQASKSTSSRKREVLN